LRRIVVADFRREIVVEEPEKHRCLDASIEGTLDRAQMSLDRSVAETAVHPLSIVRSITPEEFVLWPVELLQRCVKGTAARRSHAGFGVQAKGLAVEVLARARQELADAARAVVRLIVEDD